MEEEKEILKNSLNKIWSDLKEKNCQDYSSKEITSSWKNKRIK